MSHWLVDQLQIGLQLVDQPDLIRGAAEHCLLEDPYRDQRPSKRISPTLISEECRLARLKRFRKHDPQPGWKWRATKQGRPSASSNMHTLRGTFAEGMAVTALRATGMQILGVSPTCVFEAQEWTETQFDTCRAGRHMCDAAGECILSPNHPCPASLEPREINWLAYPDVVMLREGQPELIQMKCPSVHAITRYRRDGPASLERRYGPQAMAEMHIGRLLGMPVARNHILCFAFEGTLPGSDEAKAGQELHAIAHTIEWQGGTDVFCRNVAEEILEDDANADRGIWPVAYAADNWAKWPCSYCNYPRINDGSQFTCEEHTAWEPQLLTPGSSSSSPQTGSLVTLSPVRELQSSSTTAPATVAPTTPSPRAPSLAPLPRLQLPPPPPPKAR